MLAIFKQTSGRGVPLIQALGPMTDSALQAKPPAPVLTVVLLIAISCALALVRFLALFGGYKSGAAVAGQFMIFFVAYLVGRALYKGRNWVRIFVISVIVVGLLLIPFLPVPPLPTTWERMLYGIQGLIQICMVVLLLLPSSRRWYKS